ncbi:MAG: polysaccharide deacetylase family protein [Anaerolineales bacterium]|nr:polysaccharide deacetylase family protein [Anaerolineales bacterium]
MMHRSNANFDSVLFLQELVAILKAHSFHVITYREISANPAITTIEQGRLAIITIDDISLQYPMAPSVEAMIEILLEAGYPAVLGIVTEGVNPDPLVVSRLRQLNELGWEIATHTDQHSNLGLMEQSAPRYIFTEISLSQDKIENAVGVRPITLILPEGQMVNDRTQIERAGIVWIVGINGGNSYDSTRDSFYVGREGPSGTAALTFEIMMRRFAP